jgi:hypothetical protein
MTPVKGLDAWPGGNTLPGNGNRFRNFVAVIVGNRKPETTRRELMEAVIGIQIENVDEFVPAIRSEGRVGRGQGLERSHDILNCRWFVQRVQNRPFVRAVE